MVEAIGAIVFCFYNLYSLMPARSVLHIDGTINQYSHRVESCTGIEFSGIYAEIKFRHSISMNIAFATVCLWDHYMFICHDCITEYCLYDTLRAKKNQANSNYLEMVWKGT